jgi:hypothetical protein
VRQEGEHDAAEHRVPARADGQQPAGAVGQPGSGGRRQHDGDEQPATDRDQCRRHERPRRQQRAAGGERDTHREKQYDVHPDDERHVQRIVHQDAVGRPAAAQLPEALGGQHRSPPDRHYRPEDRHEHHRVA